MVITREAIEIAAADSNLEVLDAITKMQSVAAKAKDEDLLEQLCNIKEEIVDEKFFS